MAPTTRLTLLGVTPDTDSMTIALPDAKRIALQDTIGELLGRQKCTKRALQSVVRRLVHAEKCVVSGWAFTRRLLDLAGSVDAPNPRIRITAAARAGLTSWWATYLPQWNSTFPLLPPLAADDRALVLHSDSSRWGTGPWAGQRCWLYQWPPGVADGPGPSMTLLELLPVLVSCVMWVDTWRGRRLRVRCDKFGAVGVVRRGWSGDRRMPRFSGRPGFPADRRQRTSGRTQSRRRPALPVSRLRGSPRA